MTHNPDVMQRLVEHARLSGCKASAQEIQEYVAMGEHIAHTLQHPSAASQRLAQQFGTHAVATHLQPAVPFNANMQTTRALSWFFVACAAQQDANRANHSIGLPASTGEIAGQKVQDLSIKGAYVLNDPGQVFARFLNSSPLTYSRISTHFNERSTSQTQAHGQPVQRGIEDPQRKLPGEHGAVVFDSLVDPNGQATLFVKFESVGMPSANAGDENGEGKVGTLRAMVRKVKHGLDFLRTRFSHSAGMDRKEHVYKGPLKDMVFEPYMALMKEAEKSQRGMGLRPKDYEKMVKHSGLVHIEQQLTMLQHTLQSNQEVGSKLWVDLHNLWSRIDKAKTILGRESDMQGITRRGAETHIDLEPGVYIPPTPFHQQITQLPTGLTQNAVPSPSATYTVNINQQSQTLQMPAGIHPAAAKDWIRNEGTSIGGVTYRKDQADLAGHALIALCNGNTQASEWVSRYTNQQIGQPFVLHFMQQLGFPLPGNDVTLTYEVVRSGPDSVDVRLHYSYEASASQTIPSPNHPNGISIQQGASAQGAVTVRLDHLSQCTPTQPPTAQVVVPLFTTTSGLPTG